MRECGLKLQMDSSDIFSLASLPVRECGLKYGALLKLHIQSDVTPGAGVWIEIPRHADRSANGYVTPGAGVWIEIPFWRYNAHVISVTPAPEIGRASCRERV